MDQLHRSRMRELLGQETGENGATRPRTLSLQITPRKAAWAASPLRHSIAEGSPGLKGVTGLLHALISDAMLDFRQETRAEMVGLHLDLVRMGRAWRRETRETMREYVGDLKELREENRKLREENERLRRGY
jgi:protein NEDD1